MVAPRDSKSDTDVELHELFLSFKAFVADDREDEALTLAERVSSERHPGTALCAEGAVLWTGHG